MRKKQQICLRKFNHYYMDSDCLRSSTMYMGFLNLPTEQLGFDPCSRTCWQSAFTKVTGSSKYMCFPIKEAHIYYIQLYEFEDKYTPMNHHHSQCHKHIYHQNIFNSTLWLTLNPILTAIPEESPI